MMNWYPVFPMGQAPDLIPANIKNGVTIFGVTGTFYGVNEVNASHSPCVGFESDASWSWNGVSAWGSVRFYDMTTYYQLRTAVNITVAWASSPYPKYQCITYGEIDKTTGQISLLASVNDSIGSSASTKFELRNDWSNYIAITSEVAWTDNFWAIRDGSTLVAETISGSLNVGSEITPVTSIEINWITYTAGNVYSNYYANTSFVDAVAGAAFITLSLS